jgi:hypothetical protein
MIPCVTFKRISLNKLSELSQNQLIAMCSECTASTSCDLALSILPQIRQYKSNLCVDPDARMKPSTLTRGQRELMQPTTDSYANKPENKLADIARNSRDFQQFRDRLHNPTERTMNNHTKNTKVNPYQIFKDCEGNFEKFRQKLRER